MQKLLLLQSLGEVIGRPSYPRFFGEKLPMNMLKQGGSKREYSNKIEWRNGTKDAVPDSLMLSCLLHHGIGSQLNSIYKTFPFFNLFVRHG